jgi:hypothetical protein
VTLSDDDDASIHPSSQRLSLSSHESDNSGALPHQTGIQNNSKHILFGMGVLGILLLIASTIIIIPKSPQVDLQRT